MITNVKLGHIKNKLPKRKAEDNKTNSGHAYLIAGGRNFLGAGVLCALAATKIGAGYTHLMCEMKNYPWLKFPDFIVHPLKISQLKIKDDYSYGVGPGLGINSFTENVIKWLLKNKIEKVILDADALTVLSRMKSQLKLPPSWILTPHEGELAKLLSTTSLKVKSDRLKSLIKAHEKYGCHILLKGSKNLFIDNEGKKYCMSEGSVALSKAGTGDVLTGLISGLRAQGLKPLDAMCVATYIHGRASKEYLKEGNDILSLRPVDLIELIPKTVKKMRA